MAAKNSSTKANVISLGNCEYPDCLMKTMRGRYCPCHHQWLIKSGQCYNCRKQKENPRAKVCMACHQIELLDAKTCHFPECKAETEVRKGSEERYRYCRCHSSWLIKHGLCYNCCYQKEVAELKLCTQCHQMEQRAAGQAKRIQAIQKGLCTNYWKCEKEAARRGGMCTECYVEFVQKRSPQGGVAPQSEPAVVTSQFQKRKWPAPAKVDSDEAPQSTVDEL